MIDLKLVIYLGHSKQSPYDEKQDAHCDSKSAAHGISATARVCVQDSCATGRSVGEAFSWFETTFCVGELWCIVRYRLVHTQK